MLYFAKARGILVLFSTHLTWFIEVASLRNLRQVYHSNDSTIFFLLSKRPFRTIIICWRRRQKCAWRIGRNNPWYSSSVRRSWDCQLMSCGPTVHRSIGRSLGRRRPKLCASIADEWWTTGGPATERWYYTVGGGWRPRRRHQLRRSGADGWAAGRWTLSSISRTAAWCMA